MRPPASLLPRVLLLATAGFAVVVALWFWLWLQLGAAMGDVSYQLGRVEVILYLVACPGLCVVAPLWAWRAPRAAGSSLVFGGLFLPGASGGGTSRTTVAARPCGACRW